MEICLAIDLLLAANTEVLFLTNIDTLFVYIIDICRRNGLYVDYLQKYINVKMISEFQITKIVFTYVFFLTQEAL